MDNQITKNFTLSELTYSDTAKAKKLDNTPTEIEYNNMKNLCENVLQPLRDALGKPIRVNSCYRGKQLNEAVGGSKTSQHCKGQAADIEIIGMSNYDLACYIRDNFDFDQLILEFTDNIKNELTDMEYSEIPSSNIVAVNVPESVEVKDLQGQTNWFDAVCNFLSRIFG